MIEVVCACGVRKEFPTSNIWEVANAAEAAVAFSDEHETMNAGHFPTIGSKDNE